MLESDEDAVIVRSTVEMAHNLGLSVVAEGVESEQHVAVLRALGCDVGQGYHYARPLAAAEFDCWLTGRDQPAAAPAIALAR